MNHRKNPITRLLTLFLLVPGALSCISQEALQQELATRDAEIMELRDERDLLDEQLQSERGEKGGLESALAEARLKLAQRPKAVEAASPRGTGDRLQGLQGLGVPVAIRDGRVVITLPSAITFASGKSDIKDSAKSVLKGVAERLKREYGGDATFHIEGHTDSDPIKKSEFGSNRERTVRIARTMRCSMTYRRMR